MLCHHIGAELQPSSVKQIWEKNSSGVPKQWTIQRELAKAPKISGLLRVTFKII